MVILTCGNNTCQYATADVEIGGATALLNSHITQHNSNSNQSTARLTGRAERMKRPSITTETSMQQYSFFLRNWTLFKKYLNEEEITTELLACCDEELRGNLFRAHISIENSTEKVVLEAIKSLAVKSESIMVARVNHVKCRQALGEPIRKFHARLKGYASICDYTKKFKDDNETEHTVSYEDEVLRQIIAANMVDSEIQRDLLSKLNISDEQMTADQMVNYIEGKENGKESALKLSNQHSTNALHSTYKKSTRPPIQTYSQTVKPRPTAHNQSKDKCSYCGKYGHGNYWGKGSAHMHKQLGCPAYTKTCSRCNRLGHFTTECRMISSPKQSTAAAEERYSEEDDHFIRGAIGIHQD